MIWAQAVWLQNLSYLIPTCFWNAVKSPLWLSSNVTFFSRGFPCLCTKMDHSKFKSKQYHCILQSYQSYKPSTYYPYPNQVWGGMTQRYQICPKVKKEKTGPVYSRLNSFWTIYRDLHSSPLGYHLPERCIRTESQKRQAAHWHKDRNQTTEQKIQS